MSTKYEQLAALSQIRQLIKQHFPYVDFYWLGRELEDKIKIEENEEIRYDKEQKMYVLDVHPACKVCHTTGKLIEIPLKQGKFSICRDCRDEIANAKTLIAITEK